MITAAASQAPRVSGNGSSVHAGRETLLNHFADALQLKGRSPSTIAVYLADIVRALDMIGVDPLDLTSEHLYRWDASSAARKLAPSTVSRYRVSMKLFLEFLHREYNFKPLHLEIGNIKARISDPKLPHPEDIQEILHKQDEDNPTHARDAAMIALLAGTGVRVGELIGMNIGDVTVRKVRTPSGERMVWAFRITAVKPRGRYRDINGGRADDKTDSLTRHFGMWYLKRVHNLGGHKPAAHLPLFADEADPRKRLAQRSIRDRIKAAARRADRPDIAAWIHPHSLRHYFSTFFVANGGELIALQYHLGHSNILTTQKYVHLKEKISAAAMLRANPMKDVLAKPIEQLTNDALARLVQNLIPSAS